MTALRITSILLLIACTVCFGCRAKPAPDSDFLQDPELMKPHKGVPYNRSYINPRYRDKVYTEIYVAPVNTAFMTSPNLWERATLANINKSDVEKDIAMLAEYLRNAFIKACETDPNKKFKVVDHPDPDTLILELAIVQLVPSKVELQAVGMVPIGFVGLAATGVEVGASAASRSEDQGKGVIAMEARTRDGATGELVSMFADRQHPPTAVLDVKALFWWKPAKAICDEWARQFVELANHPSGKKVRGIPNFRLFVW